MRSPGEYKRGHIPSAVNVPVFNDSERAEVGTIYKKESREAAILRALQIVEPKRSTFLLAVGEIALAKGETKKNDPEVFIHCWRGGFRSGRFADFLSENGFKVNVLLKGYKAYRNLIHNEFGKSWKLIVLGGFTGSGKTGILEILSKRGHQVINFEEIANHKGSAFGHLGQEAQPTTEQFQNNLWEKWKVMDPALPLVVEDESQAIGTVRIPDELFVQMRSCPVLKLEMSRHLRAKRLVQEYGSFDKNLLRENILKISKRLGGDAVSKALEALENGDLYTVGVTVLKYYDKAYSYGLSKRSPRSIFPLHLQECDTGKNALKAEEFLLNKNTLNGQFQAHTI